MTDTERLISLFRSGTTAELGDAIAELTKRVGQRESERIYDRALKIWDRETEQQDDTDPQTAAAAERDAAAARIEAWLDGYNPILPKAGVRTLLRERAELLADRKRMAAELEQVRGERAAVEAWLGGRIEALRKVLRDERDATRAVRTEAESLRQEFDEAAGIVLEIGNALDSGELYAAIGDLAQLFAPRTSALAERMEAADLALVQRTAACVWVWEYAARVGEAICDVATATDLSELKKQIAESFPDHTWEEVERRGIRGTSILVGYGNGRYADTGHWVYRRRANERDAGLLALARARAATDNDNRTPLADVLKAYGMTEDDMEAEG